MGRRQTVEVGLHLALNVVHNRGAFSAQSDNMFLA